MVSNFKHDNNYQAPLWLVLGHHYSLASVGIADGVVWLLYSRFTSRKQKDANDHENSNSRPLQLSQDVDSNI